MQTNKEQPKLIKNINKIFTAVQRSFVFCAVNCPVYLLINISMTILSVLSPYIILLIWKSLLDSLTSDTSNIWLYIGLYMAVQFVCQLVEIMQIAYQQNSRDRISQILKNKIIDKLEQIDIAMYDDPAFHRLLSVLNHIPNYSSIVDSTLSVVSSIFSLVITLLVLVDGYLHAAVVILIFQIPTVIILSYNSLNAYKLWVEENDDRRRIGYYRGIMTNASHAKEVRLYNLGSFFFGLYNNYWEKMYRSAMKLQKKGAFLKIIGNIIGMIGFTFLISILVNQAASGVLSAGDIYYYIGIGVVFMSNTERFGIFYSQLYNNATQCGEILDEYLDIKSSMKQGDRILEGTPAIEFRNVSFKYPNSDNYVLENISFRLEAGEKLLLAGINGAGKTTLVKLLIRMYDPTEGLILYNDIPAQEYSLESIREHFGVLFQDTQLYARSFMKNIEISRISHGKNDPDAYEKALYMSGADKVRKKLAFSDETEITRSFDDNGYEPSGGERQRIGLARAYYHSGDFVILDEPSSAQDAISEDHIFTEFVRNHEGKSAVLISHRMSAASIVDKIALIEHGQLLAFGRHSELYKSSERYRNIYDMQASGYKTDGMVNSDV